MGRIGKFVWSVISLAVFVLASSTPAAAQHRQEQGDAGQSQSQAQGQTQAQTQRQNQDQSQSENDDATKRDLATLNELLDQHPDAEQQLKANPYLINDPNFLSTQPEIKAFLAGHPEVKSQLEENPVDFMRRENRLQGMGVPTEGERGASVATSNRELGRMDEFLDEHRDVAQQLALNPSLINDQNYLAQHRELALLLSAHPNVRLQLAANPGYFLQRENQPGSASVSAQVQVTNKGVSPTANASSDRDREVGEMDQFLDEHGGLKQDLRQRPVLINDANYLAQHPELGLFLDAHPGIRQDFSEHPEIFVAANAQPESAHTATVAAGDAEQPERKAHPDNPIVDLENQENTRMAQFLEDHPNIRKDLGKNPWLVNQSNYLKHHKELERFLSEYPQIREKLADNPTYFERKRNGVEAVTTAADPGMKSFRFNVNNIDLELMNQFLQRHKKTAKQLENDPALVTSQHYVDHNKDLREFFNVHPHILEEFRQGPRSFMDQENQLRAELR